MNQINQSPEKIGYGDAPASVTYSITSKNGYNILFTVRAESGLDLLETMDSVEKKLIAKEYKPQIKPTFGQKKEIEYVPEKLCPVDSGKLKVIHSKDNKTYWTCENGKYDYATKTTTGCKFICSPETYEQRKTQLKETITVPEDF